MFLWYCTSLQWMRVHWFLGCLKILFQLQKLRNVECDWKMGTSSYVLTYSMVQDILWKTDSHSACQTITCFLYGTRKFITVLTKDRHRTLSWVSWIRFAPSIPISLNSILMLSSHLRLGLPIGLLPLGHRTKSLETLFPSPMHATCPAYLIFLDLITLTILDEE
jgi:hypothetical protein